MKRIETENSIWFFNEGAMEYMRMPKSEGGVRTFFERLNQLDSEMLDDVVWLPYVDLDRVDYDDCSGKWYCYNIKGPKSVYGTFTSAVLAESG